MCLPNLQLKLLVQDSIRGAGYGLRDTMQVPPVWPTSIFACLLLPLISNGCYKAVANPKTLLDDSQKSSMMVDEITDSNKAENCHKVTSNEQYRDLTEILDELRKYINNRVKPLIKPCTKTISIVLLH